MSSAPIAASVDIGTNSVKITVARRGDDGRLDVLLDTTTITRLGKGVDAAGRLDPEAVTRTLDALAEFGRRAKELGAAKVAAAGTSALRDAENGPEFVAAAGERLGGPVEVIAGEREAHLTYTAARLDPDLKAALAGDGHAGATLATIDIGGGSTEIVIGRGDAVLYRDSLQLGAVRLTERVAPSDPWTDVQVTDAILRADQALSTVPEPGEPVAVIGSGGTIANLASAERGRPEQGIDGLHATRLSRAQIESRVRALAALPLAERRNVPGMEPDRADVIVAGAVIQARALYRLSADSVYVSLRGLRYGLLYELLDGLR
jgi:exopolyphosphatase/guanosine-5'-triphosphate,3'-diphosphate pyrophosphatase